MNMRGDSTRESTPITMHRAESSMPRQRNPRSCWDWLLSKRQRLRHFKAKTEGTEDSEEHACTGFDAAILYTRNVRLVGSHSLYFV